jgi:acyl-lipid Delta6-acetylenase / acyl-lipid (9-3)-desaturase
MGKGGDSQAAAAAPPPLFTKISRATVQQHDTPDNAWVVYRNQVYNVSHWHAHPGGGVLFTHAGEDCTDIFDAFHAAGSHRVMRQFLVGVVPEDEMDRGAAAAAGPPPRTEQPTNNSSNNNNNNSQLQQQHHQAAFVHAYRDLRLQLQAMGLFQTKPGFYVYKVTSTWLLWATAVAMVYYSDQAMVHAASAILLGLFFQQSGWLAHDFLHHQVFDKRKYGDYAGLVIGNLWQGFSVQWWKNKHNGHHAVPNLHATTAAAHDGDPDIDTMPLLAWSLHQAQQFAATRTTASPLVTFWIRHQAVFYFPILLLARLSWLNESAKVTFGFGAASENAALELKYKGLQYPKLEKLAMTGHYTWMLILSTGFFRFGALYSLAYFMLATCSCGWFLATVFGLGHNGMATYSAATRPDFWNLQVTTTRNITGGHGIPQAFVDWFCGGLQYQVDHHLFPTLPRHNLKQTHGLISSFCKEWGVHYHEADLVDGNIEVLRHLADVSNEFLVEFVRDGPTM